MGPGEGLVGARYSPSPTLPLPPPRVHPSHHRPQLPATRAGHVPGVNMVVGLRSVGQLSLGAQISGSRGMTEGYNLVEIGRINNHFPISGKD